jgi:uncharacterized protein DUF4386
MQSQVVKLPEGEFSPQVYARTAGFLYLLVIAGGAVAEVFVRQRLLVPRNAAATASNFLAHEQLVRWGFAADIFAGLCVLPLMLLLYELLKVVNRRVALLVVFCSLVGTAVQSTALLGHYAPLVFLTRGRDFGVNLELLQAQSYMALQLQGIGYAAGLVFFGGTMLGRGYLIVKCNFLPRIIGVLLMLAGVCYMLNSLIDFVAPAIAGYAMALLIVPGIAESSLCLWLLIKGLNVPKWQAAQAASA